MVLVFGGVPLLLSGIVPYGLDLTRYIVTSDNDAPAVAVDLDGKLYEVEFGPLNVAVDRSGSQPHFYVFTHEEDRQVGQYVAIASGDFRINDKQDNPFYDGVIGAENPAQYISTEKHFVNASEYKVRYRLLKPGSGEVSEFMDGFGGTYTQAIHRWKCQNFGSRTSCGTVNYAFTDISKIVSLYGKTLIGRYDEKKKMVILSISPR
jgi:hypothetical protein